MFSLHKKIHTGNKMHLISSLILYSRGGEPISYCGLHELYNIAGKPQNQLILS